MSEQLPEWLLGVWRLERVEQGLEILPGTRMEFRPAGELVYTIEIDDRRAVFELEYTVEGDLLTTVHPEGGHRTRARFSPRPGGVLEFDFGGGRAWFVREGLM